MSTTSAVSHELIDLLLQGPPTDARRAELGELLLADFDADIFASYVADESGPYGRPVAVNAAPDMVRRYDEYYRNVDNLTPKLRRLRRATAIHLPDHMGEEFAHDFLQARDMYIGMNYFPTAPAAGAIDIRIWRPRTATKFSSDDVRRLQRVGDLVNRIWPTTPLDEDPLTPREHDVARLVALGLSDGEICLDLGMAKSTLRTHLTHIFAKTSSNSRGAVGNWYHKRFSA